MVLPAWVLEGRRRGHWGSCCAACRPCWRECWCWRRCWCWDVTQQAPKAAQSAGPNCWASAGMRMRAVPSMWPSNVRGAFADRGRTVSRAGSAAQRNATQQHGTAQAAMGGATLAQSERRGAFEGGRAARALCGGFDGGERADGPVRRGMQLCGGVVTTYRQVGTYFVVQQVRSTTVAGISIVRAD